MKRPILQKVGNINTGKSLNIIHNIILIIVPTQNMSIMRLASPRTALGGMGGGALHRMQSVIHNLKEITIVASNLSHKRNM